MSTILTVGHSNRPIEAFLALLAEARVEAVADVRTAPVSRYATWFDAAPLSAALRRVGIAYVPMPEVGGRPNDPALYLPDGFLSYHALRATPAWHSGLERLVKGAARMRIAVMCSEEDPAGCHRRLAIAPDLATRGLEVEHLRADGRHQSEAELVTEVAARAPAERRRIEEALVAGRSVRVIRAPAA